MTIHPATRWLVFAIIALTVLVGLIIWGRTMNKQRSPAEENSASWRDVLAGYVDFLNQDDGRITVVSKTRSAVQPERFIPEMSRYTWSSSRAFYSDYAAESASGTRLLPLSFPPTELWCAVLMYKATTDPALNIPNDYELVAVARHAAGKQAAWVVHRLAPSGDILSLQETLDVIGCDVKAAEFGMRP